MKVAAFLFTDIEGSTGRWEHRPQAMLEAIREHDLLLRGVVEAHGGIVFKTLGDGICAAFEDAAAALSAAIAAQRQLRARDWSHVEGLAVRMALHSGQAERHGDDFLGQPLNRVARLLAAGNGGQILLSGAFADAVRSRLPEEVQLRPLGVYRLKDLQEPERIYQAVVPSLPEVFRPLRTLEAVPNNLPIQSTPLIGRRADVTAISALLRESTLVTVAGVGGVGKTRVALQCGAEAIDRFEHGVWFINLAPLSDSGLIAPTTLAALGAGPVDRGAETEALLDHLRPREALLVFDNCEHLAGEVAGLVSRIREACPRICILATSRELLHVQGERVYRLEPLDVGDASELFAQRASAVASFDAAAHAESIRNICERLDGIPLAIELAAARTRALGVADIFSRLDERFKLLSSGTRGALPRQQTLRALIDWSYDLLVDAEQLLFERLSVFRGSFSLAAAAAICEDCAGDEYAVLDLLTSLADKSLITAIPGSTTRYKMLESVREYARAKNGERDPEANVAERHANYFALLAEQAYAEFDTRMPAGWLEHLRPDLDNFRAALSWSLGTPRTSGIGAQLAADCGPMFMRLELLGEGLQWCERARSEAGASAQNAARLEYVASMMHNNLGAYRKALACAERAVALYRTSHDERGLIRALSQAAQQYARSHRFEEAEPPAREAVERARKLGEPRVLVAVLRRCAFALPPERIAQARDLFAEALQSARTAGEMEEACLVLEWWAEREAAALCFERAMDLAVEGLNCADRDSRIYLESNITGYALASGRLPEAAQHATEALALALQAEHPIACAIAFAYCAPLHATDPQQAALLFGFARARMRELEWDASDGADRIALENAERLVNERLDGADFSVLMERGAGMTRDEALRILDRTLSSARVPSGAASPT